jgi:hypothetical protein
MYISERAWQHIFVQRFGLESMDYLWSFADMICPASVSQLPSIVTVDGLLQRPIAFDHCYTPKQRPGPCG